MTSVTVRVEIREGVPIRFDVPDLATVRLRLHDSLFPGSAWCQVVYGKKELQGTVLAIIRKLSRDLCAQGAGPVPFEQEVKR